MSLNLRTRHHRTRPMATIKTNTISTKDVISELTRQRLVESYQYNMRMFNKDEFIIDVNRIVRIVRLCSKIHDGLEVNYRLLLNELQIIDNVFGDSAFYALFEYLEDHAELIPIVYTLLFYTNRISETPVVDEFLLNQLKALETK